MFATPDKSAKTQQKTKQSCAWANCWALKIPESEYCGTHHKEALRGHVKEPKTTSSTAKKSSTKKSKPKPASESSSSSLFSVFSSSPSPAPTPAASSPAAAAAPVSPEPFKTGIAKDSRPKSPSPKPMPSTLAPAVESRVSKPKPTVSAAPNCQGSEAEKEAAVRKWVLDVLQEEGKMDLQGLLKSGVRLCKLMNALFPANVPLIPHNEARLAKENIGTYLTACTKMGFKKADLFAPEDLTDEKDMPAVVHNLLVLEAHMRTVQAYQGPTMAGQ